MPRNRIRHVGALGLAVTVTLASTSGAASGPATGSQLAASSGQASSMIAFISEPPVGGYCGLVYVMNADGSGQQRLAGGAADECAQEGEPAWSPDGQEIAIVSSGKIFVTNVDGGGQRRLTRTAGYQGSPAWSPDGRKITFARYSRRLLETYVVNTDGTGLRRLTRNGAGNLAAVWSPDGRRIAYVGRDGNSEIYVINADGTEQQRLTHNTMRDSGPVWSPDGRRIAFESNWQVWVMNADGSAQRRLTRNGARNVSPAWSPDGQRIAFERRIGRDQYGSCSRCGRAANFEVHVINADGTKERTLAKEGGQPSWSPDGTKIAFEKRSDLYVMNADGSGRRLLTHGSRRESRPVWSPAG